MSKINVDAYRTTGRPLRIAIDPDATAGASLGSNFTLGAAVTLPSGVVLPAGTVLTAQQVLNAFVTSSTDGSGAVADWPVITNIPPNIEQAAALNTVGIVVRRTGGVWSTRTLTAAAGIAINFPDGDGGDPQIATSVVTAAGTYTPTVTAVNNVSAVSVEEAQYLRVGNTVTVSGRGSVTATLTAATLTTFRMTLPVASSFGTQQDAAGVGVVHESIYAAGEVVADAANEQALFSYHANVAGARSVTYQYTYQVI